MIKIKIQNPTTGRNEITLCSFTNFLHKLVPMKPAPPVTTTVFIMYYKSYSVLLVLKCVLGGRYTILLPLAMLPV